jgi:hypothetical protein
MLKRSTFSVDESAEQDGWRGSNGRRTVILEQSRSDIEPPAPDHRINILIAVVLLLCIFIGILSMNVSSLSTKV